MVERLVYVPFASGVTDQRVELDLSHDSALDIGVYAMSHSGVGAANTVCIEIQDVLPAVAKATATPVGAYVVPPGPAVVPQIIPNTGVRGSPVPVDALNPAPVFDPPFPIGSTGRGRFRTMHIRLLTIAGAAFTHTGFALWLCLRTQRQTADLKARLRADEMSPPYLSMVDDHKWDHVRSVREVFSKSRQ